ncbi:MAG TPA: Asp23/Gls24 family envelope stress response protein [Roseiflexaceae bacterium]|nr:Asp23/Gls24 family envelope stress response protein [Roseiflexaceae bacterium]
MAPNVLNLVSTAVRAVPGVVRLAKSADSALPHVVQGMGVVVRSGEMGLVVDCSIHAAMDTPLLDVGLAVQATVAAVLQDIAGLAVSEVNVYILDVECNRG